MGLSAAILAGGKSLRMHGRNKALLEVGGRKIIEGTIHALRPLFRDLFIISGDPGRYTPFGLPVHPDVHRDIGSLGGIHAALYHSREPKTFCVACDMPFLSPAVVGLLCREAEEERWDIIVPRLPEGLEPLCAVYSRSLLPAIEKMIAGNERRIRPLAERSRTRYVDGDVLRRLDAGLSTFFNINTPADLERARAIGEGPAP